MIETISISHNPVLTGARRYMRNLARSAGSSADLGEAATFSGYSHKIRALGGFWQCGFVLHGELAILMEMLADGWMRHVICKGTRGLEAWEGFVAAMELSIEADMPVLKITCYGYYRTLFWRVHNETGFGHVNAAISNEVAYILTQRGQFIGSQSIETNVSNVDRYHDADRFAGDILFDFCAAGDSAYHRYVIGCYEDRQARYQQIAKYKTTG